MIEELSLTTYCPLDGTDDTDGLERAYTDAKAQNKGLYLGNGKTLRVTRNVTLHGVNLDFRGTVSVDFNGTGITIGGVKVKQYIRQANSSSGRITLRVIGGVQSYFELGECSYLQLYADSDSSYQYAKCTAYSTFELGVVPTLEIATNPTPTNPNLGQWINENRFRGGAFRTLTIGGTYPHDNNVFDCPTFENATLNFNKGLNNKFTNCRFEGVNTINFAEGTRDNVIEKLYSETERAVFSSSPNIIVNDSGLSNIVVRDQWKHYKLDELFSLSARNAIFNDQADVEGYKGGVQAGLHKLKITSPFKTVYKSPIIPLPTNGNMGISLDSDVAAWSVRIFVYDANLNPIKVEPTVPYLSRNDLTFGFYSKTGSYNSSALLNQVEGVLVNTDGLLKYFQIIVEPGNATANMTFERVSLFLQYLKHNRNIPFNTGKKEFRPIVSSAITKGFGRLGDIVPLTTGGYYQNTYSTNTVMVASALASATHIYVKGENIGNTGTVSSGSTTTNVILSNGGATDGKHNNSAIAINNETRYITNYVAATKTATLNAPLSITPSAGNAYTMYFHSLAIGDIIGVLLDDLTTHWTTVQSFSAGKVTLTNALPSISGLEKRVVGNRWVLKLE
ncbi:hypothetical protein [Peribacillus sp. NPDC060253]|uniref:hypothetical protein n=1 Tax=Peribacillus sp. NPDC060253 TaxID=3347084 RepID=UPI00366A08D6